MKKLICAAMALMMTATMFCGCRNTSTDKNGRVTEATTARPSTTEPAATTVPHATTIPHETTVPNIIEDMTGTTEHGSMTGTEDATIGAERKIDRKQIPPTR